MERGKSLKKKESNSELLNFIPEADRLSSTAIIIQLGVTKYCLPPGE